MMIDGHYRTFQSTCLMLFNPMNTIVIKQILLVISNVLTFNTVCFKTFDVFLRGPQQLASAFDVKQTVVSCSMAHPK